MKGLYRLVQYDDGSWGMRFRYIFRYEEYYKEFYPYPYIRDERTTWVDALILADKDIDTDAIPDRFKKTFSLEALGVEIPSEVRVLSIDSLDGSNWLSPKESSYSASTISIGDLCKGTLFATSSTEKPLKELAENLGRCPEKVLEFILKQGITEPYFIADDLQEFSCNAHDATLQNFGAEHYK